MEHFRNIKYDYATSDDTFIARGLHLNQIIDEINTVASTEGLKYVISTVTKADYTFVLGDAGKLVIHKQTKSAASWVIPLNTTVAYEEGTKITIHNSSTQLCVIDSSAVTLQSLNSYDTISLYGTAELIKIGTDTWLLTGDIE